MAGIFYIKSYNANNQAIEQCLTGAVQGAYLTVTTVKTITNANLIFNAVVN